MNDEHSTCYGWSLYLSTLKGSMNVEPAQKLTRPNCDRNDEEGGEGET